MKIPDRFWLADSWSLTSEQSMEAALDKTEKKEYLIFESAWM